MIRPVLALVLLGSVARATPAEKAIEARVSEQQLAAHVRFLADDLLEGRAPASRGDEIAMRYVAAELERLGYKPYGDFIDGARSFVQRFALVSLRPKVTAPPVVRGTAGSLTLKPGEDFVVAPGMQTTSAELKDAPIVFVGYGIVAPEEHWDDYAGIDVRGKVVVVMNNDPSTDPKRFAGTTRLYYGRWDYKYAEAARHGAAGAIIIHTTPSAGYPWQVVQTSWSGASFELPAAGEPRMSARMWVTEERARDLLRVAGVAESLASLTARAELPGFKAVPLDAKLSVTLAVTADRVQTGNVLGLLPGTDPSLGNQVVFVTAHHDHLGRRKPEAGAKTTSADDIYNGALDNASGVAALLSLAEAFAAHPQRRGIVFASVGAEESGLLGSGYLCTHLPVPAGLVAAELNIDGVNIWGRTHDVTYVGFGKSSLDDVVRTVAAEQGRVVVPDQFPDRGSFYRSDQLNFARIGVPSIYLATGVEFAGHDRAWGRALVDDYVKTRYHQPSDQIDSTWKLDGAIEDLRLEVDALARIANDTAMPRWRAGDEFEQARLNAPTR